MADFATRPAAAVDRHDLPPMLPPKLPHAGVNPKLHQQQQIATHESHSRTFMIGCVVLALIVLLVTAGNSVPASLSSDSGAVKHAASPTLAGASSESEEQAHSNKNNNNNNNLREQRFKQVKEEARQRKLAAQMRYLTPEKAGKVVSYTQRRGNKNSAGGVSNNANLHIPAVVVTAVPYHHIPRDAVAGRNHNHGRGDAGNINAPVDELAEDRQQMQNKLVRPGDPTTTTTTTTVDAAAPEQHDDDHTTGEEDAAAGAAATSTTPHPQDDGDHGDDQTSAAATGITPSPPATAAASATSQAATPAATKNDTKEEEGSNAKEDNKPAAAVVVVPVSTSAAGAAAASDSLTACNDWRFECGARSFVVINPVPKSSAHAAGPPVCSPKSGVNRSLIQGDYGSGAKKCFVPKLAHADSKVDETPVPIETIEKCFSLRQNKFPLVGQAQVITVPLHGSGVLGGQKLACYNGPNDMVCKLYAANFRWEPIVADWLSYAAVMLRRFRQLQFLNFVRRLRAKVMTPPPPSVDGVDAAAAAAPDAAKSSFSSTTSKLKLGKLETPNIGSAAQYFVDDFRPVLTSDVDVNALTDDNYGVEFLDIGMHVGTMSNHMWRMGFPVKGFEPMPTNINLLLATRCLNRINTEFPSAEQCKREFFHTRQLSAATTEQERRALASCLTPAANTSSRGAVGRSACPVAEAVPFQLSYVAAGAKSGEVCAMFSDAGNIGDVLVSCDKKLTDQAMKADKVFIRDSTYTVRGLVTTQRVDDYIFRDQERMCTAHDEAGGVRFQHNAFRRQKELRNVATRAVLAKQLEQQKRAAVASSSSASSDGNHNKNSSNNSVSLKSSTVTDSPLAHVFAATDSIAKARLDDGKWRMRELNAKRNKRKNGGNETAAVSSSALAASLASAAKDVLLGDATLLPRLVPDSANGGVKVALVGAEINEKKKADEQQHQQQTQKEIDQLLEDLMPTEGFSTKDYVVKIDVEGHEAHVISGADRWMSHAELRPKILIIENWSHLNVSGFCQTMVRYGYVGLSTRTFQWIVSEMGGIEHQATLRARGEPHDDIAWMPLKWAKVLALPEYVAKLEQQLQKTVHVPDAV